ncbi:echinoderm microtubule-associated protein-like CG42247 isoform X3 [Haliotis rufescens]|uniref:echinoderm microtubule-associated protein-like CG42247 isoform X3 n=1 Tax=Haliotis rufescens TaxID=6454 RepID=UPI00201E8485|nr:echinoderm microtubule-associated protein-like CG42247 isoform X3 [Haliotis rufescens]
MPAARSTNNGPDVPKKDINVVFKRQLLNPDDYLLEEQYWRPPGMAVVDVNGRLIYDGGGDADREASEGEVEMEEKSDEPQTFHIREYETPGRKISRDVRVISQTGQVSQVSQAGPGVQVSQGNRDSDKQYAQVNRLGPGNQHGQAYNLGQVNSVGQVSPVKDDGYGTESTPYLTVPNTESQTLHIREYDGRQRKVSWDVKVQNPVSTIRDDGYGTEGTQHQNWVNGESIEDQGQSVIDRDQILLSNETGIVLKSFSGILQEDPGGSFSERTIHLDTGRSHKSLPTSVYGRKLQDYYNFDQPKGRKVDPRRFQDEKRATRASILNKAESLLNDRRTSGINDYSSDDEIKFPSRTKPRRRNSPFKRGGHATDTEVTLKAKHREKTLTSPEVDTDVTPRSLKVKRTLPKHVLSRLNNAPKRKVNAVKRPIKKREEEFYEQPSNENLYEDIQRQDSTEKELERLEDTFEEKRQSADTREKKQRTTSNLGKSKIPERKRYSSRAVERKKETTKLSEPSQQVSEGDDDPTTTEGDVTLRKGGKGNRRYEDADGASSVNTDIKELQGSHQGKRAYFYNFKEQGSPAVIESVSSKRFPNFETLLNELTIKFQIDKGANFVYHWPSTTQIRYISDFKSHGTYIVASTAMRKGQLEAVYGKLGPKHWHIGKVKHNDSPLVRNPLPEERSPAVGQHYSDNKKPLVVWLVCNSTQKRTKVFLKPSRYFEDLMAGEITDAVNLELPPACALYAFNNDRVGKEICSLSQLVRQYRKDYTVLVCGREKVPADWAYRGSPPYSSDSYRPPLRPRPKYVIGADSAPPRVDMIQMNGNSSPRTSGVQNGIPALNRYDTVKVKINGRRRGMEKAQQNEFYASYQDMEDELGKPDRKLILDWVYGYRGSDRHRNLDILDTSELVYYVAAVVVIFDWHNHTQRFYTGHNEDITCLTIHPQQNRVATGQLQGRGSDHGAHIRIWDVDSLSTIALIGLGVFQNGITSISFSDYTLQHVDNDLMMVIDDSFRHTMTIWDVQTERMLTKTTVLAAKTNTETVTGGCFYPSEDDILITYGRQHLYFWRLDWEHDRTPYARILRDKLSGYSEDDIPTHFTALAFSSTGEVITGDSNGSIMIWSRDNDNVFSLSRSDSEINIHQSAITYLAVLADGMLLSGGGSEMFLWDTMNRYKNPQRIQVNISGNIQAIAPNHAHFEDGVIFLGTDKNCILQGHLHQKFSTIVQGHSGDSVSIAVHPKEYTTHVKAREYCFVTAGKDLVIKWSASQRIPIWKTKIEGEKCTAVAVDHHDRMVALGTKSGKVIILNDTNRGREENTIVIGAKKINTVAFSPNGMRLAVAVDDGYLHICSVDKGVLGRVHATSNVHGLSMTNIDWSRDCRFLQTSSTDFQVFFWNADKKPKLIPGHKLRDADWTTHKALVSHAILGPWQHLDAGETIKAVDRSNGPQKDLLVTGDSMGRLRLYKYPCSSSESEYRGTKAYSGAINSVMFSGDDYFVFSSASSVVNNDLKNHLGIMQWAIVEADAQVHPKYYQPNYYPHHHPHHYYPQHPHYPNPHYYNQHNPYFKRYQ